MRSTTDLQGDILELQILTLHLFILSCNIFIAALIIFCPKIVFTLNLSYFYDIIEVHLLVLSVLFVVSGEVLEIHQLQRLHRVCHEGRWQSAGRPPLNFIVKGTNFCSSARAAYNLLMRNLVRVVVLDRWESFIC